MPETPDWHPARYLASLYSPPTERAVLEALCGIENEIVASLQGGLDHHVAHARLQWWREECERVSRRQASHPLTRTLITLFGDRPDAPLAGLSGLVDTTVWDLASATFETRGELTAYCERWATATLVLAAAHALPDVRDYRCWLKIGSTMHEIEMMANLASEASSGRLRVPLDELERAAVEPDCVARLPWPERLTTLLSARYDALRVELASGVKSLPQADQPGVRGLLVWAALAWRRSMRAQHALPDALKPGRFDALGDSWVAWRAARRAMAGDFSFTPR